MKSLIVKIIIVLYIILSMEQTIGSEFLRRKRRYLVFNEGSNFETQVVVAKPLLGISFPSSWNTVVELAISFKLPNSTLRFEKYHDRPFVFHRRDRRDLYRQLENVFYEQGLDGRACVLRAICESKIFLRPGESLLKDLFHVIFRFPRSENEFLEDYDKASNDDICDQWNHDCSVSILGLFLAVT